MSQLNVAIIFGGRSTEHSISIKSARGILGQINRERYHLHLLHIDLEGRWWQYPSMDVDDDTDAFPITLLPGEDSAFVFNLDEVRPTAKIDVAFPVLHGLFGEDGTIQGLFKMVNVAFVGCGVAGSALCIDKDLTKRILIDAGIPVAPYLCATEAKSYSYEEASKALDSEVLYLKPASLGSSVGVHRVTNAEEYNAGLQDGLEYDPKVIIEPNIVGREIECAVLGNEAPQASYPGEIVMSGEAFYDFESKYVSKDAAQLHIPAQMTEEQIAEMREIACKAFTACGCEGLARVDFFMEENGRMLINEINTLPGFTEVSMYPKMWEATGIGYSELLDFLIDLGVDRYRREQALKIVSKPA